MKKTLFLRWTAGALASMVFCSSVSAYAADSTLSVSKNLVMDEAANVPHVSFAFTLSPGETAVSDSPGELSVFAGKGLDKILINGVNEPYPDQSGGSAVVGYADFEPTADTYASDIDISTGRISPSYDRKFALSELEIDFSDVEFGDPGIYRYILWEAESTGPGIEDDVMASKDHTLVRTIDIYVEYDSDGHLSIGGYIVHEGEVTGTVTSGADGESSGGSGDSGSADAKSDLSNHFDETTDYGSIEESADEDGNDDGSGGTDIEGYDKYGLRNAVSGEAGGYVNELMSSALSVENHVSGNQGRSDKYFKFTLDLRGLNPGDLITVDANEADIDETGLTASIYGTEEMNEANARDDSMEIGGQQLKADTDGSILSYSFYLKEGQSVSFLGVPETVEYVLSLDTEDYTGSYEMSGGSVTESSSDNNLILTGSIGSEDILISFDNFKKGSIPTGVALPMIPYVLLAGAALILGLILIFLGRKES